MKQERTRELDNHWRNCTPLGGFYCRTCELYTGQPFTVHDGHDLVNLPSTLLRLIKWIFELRQTKTPDCWCVGFPDHTNTCKELQERFTF